MRVSLNLVKRFVDLPKDITYKQIAYDLTLRTVEVESVTNTCDKFNNIVVGKILEVNKHPDADMLRVCMVDIGEEEPVQIVRGVQIGVTGVLAVVEGVLTSELIVQLGVFMAMTAPIWLIVGAIIALVVVVEQIGEAFGWWSSFSSMIDAMSSGIQRLWNAFVNSEPIQALISYFSDFFYTLETFFGGIAQVIGVFWDTLFGGDGGSWDILGDVIGIFGAIGDAIMRCWDFLRGIWDIVSLIVMFANPVLGIIMLIVGNLDKIGEYMGMFIDAWNLFLDSPLSTEMFGALGEAFDELKAPFQEIWTAFSEVGKAFQQVFAELFPETVDEDGKKFNPFIELIRGFAQFIINYVVPAIRVLAMVIRVLLIPLRAVAWVLQTIAGIIGIISGAVTTGTSIINSALSSMWSYIKPIYDAFRWVVDNLGKIGEGIDKFFGGKGGSDTDLTNQSKVVSGNQKATANNMMSMYKTGSNLAGNYYANKTHSNVTNINVQEGAMNVNAHNMTQKEAANVVQSGLGGYLKAQRVTRG